MTWANRPFLNSIKEKNNNKLTMNISHKIKLTLNISLFSSW